MVKIEQKFINFKYLKKEVNILTDKEKEELKNKMYLWGSYKYILRVEKSELASIKDMSRAMKDIKSMTCGHTSIASKISKPTEDGIARSITLCEGRIEKLNRLIKENMALKQEIDEIVDSLPCVEQYVLKARYVDNMSWEIMPMHIPFEMSKRHCQRFHNSALEQIHARLNKKDKNKAADE